MRTYRQICRFCYVVPASFLWMKWQLAQVTVELEDFIKLQNDAEDTFSGITWGQQKKQLNQWTNCTLHCGKMMLITREKIMYSALLNCQTSFMIACPASCFPGYNFSCPLLLEVFKLQLVKTTICKRFFRLVNMKMLAGTALELQSSIQVHSHQRKQKTKCTDSTHSLSRGKVAWGGLSLYRSYLPKTSKKKKQKCCRHG